MRIAYLGPEGTFSHEALTGALRQDDAELVGCGSIPEAVAAVQRGTVDRALVPIENSLEGAVNATLDALVREARDARIVGELVHPVHHCLIAAQPVAPEAITAVLSHPQASAQCARLLRTRLTAARVIAASSTAEAVRSVVDAPREPLLAAIGTRAAARRYGAMILAEGVEDEAGNETRFVWLARSAAAAEAGFAADPSAAWKTSIVFWGAGSDAPGWLVRCLSEFAFRGVNLTRIESRPRRDRLGSYIFFLDLDGGTTETSVADAIEALAAQTETVRVLGSYPAAAPTATLLERAPGPAGTGIPGPATTTA